MTTDPHSSASVASLVEHVCLKYHGRTDSLERTVEYLIGFYFGGGPKTEDAITALTECLKREAASRLSSPATPKRTIEDELLEKRRVDWNPPFLEGYDYARKLIAESGLSSLEGTRGEPSDDKLLLNAYGRRCYNAGRESGLKVCDELRAEIVKLEAALSSPSSAPAAIVGTCSADGTEERMIRPDGTVAIIARRRPDGWKHAAPIRKRAD